MNWVKLSTKFLFGILMTIAGVLHFVIPEFYMKIMPPYLPWHLELVYISGVCEIVLGLLLLIPRYTRMAAWGNIALLIAVFPANLYAYQSRENPSTFLTLRLPLQAFLILWVWWYTRPNNAAKHDVSEGEQ